MLSVGSRAKEAAIHARRQIIIASILILIAMPAILAAYPALARNGGHGGRGGGNGSAGRGGSDVGDNGSRTGKADTTGRNGALSNAGTETRQGRSAVDKFSADGGAISVRHRNGIAEEVSAGGRYVMRDAQGRTIVNRAATDADIDRLNSFSD